MKLTMLLTLAALAALAAADPLTNTDIIRLVQQGIAPSAVIASIQSAAATDFHITPEDQPALSEAGVPRSVIDAMVRRRMKDGSRSSYAGNDKPKPEAPHHEVSSHEAPNHEAPRSATPASGEAPAPEAPRPAHVTVDSPAAAPSHTMALNRSFPGVAFVGEKGLVHGNLVFAEHAIEFPAVRIPLESVKSATYERAAKPRIGMGLLVAWPLMFTKSKKHFLTVQYTGGYSVFQLDKSNYMQVLAAMEASTGKHVERIEEK